MSEAAPLPGSEASQPASGATAGDVRVDQDTQAPGPWDGTSEQVGADSPDESMTGDSGCGAAAVLNPGVGASGSASGSGHVLVDR
eukprot:3840685-Karenia_brevis.AAC.1